VVQTQEYIGLHTNTEELIFPEHTPVADDPVLYTLFDSPSNDRNLVVDSKSSSLIREHTSSLKLIELGSRADAASNRTSERMNKQHNLETQRRTQTPQQPSNYLRIINSNVFPCNFHNVPVHVLLYSRTNFESSTVFCIFRYIPVTTSIFPSQI